MGACQSENYVDTQGADNGASNTTIFTDRYYGTDAINRTPIPSPQTSAAAATGPKSNQTSSAAATASTKVRIMFSTHYLFSLYPCHTSRPDQA